MPDIEALYELQETDLGIEERSAELEEVGARLADESEIENARRRLEVLEVKLGQLGTSRRGIDLAVQDFELRLKKLDDRLYGGAITNPKEMEAAQEERNFMVEKRSEHEEQLLNVMVEIEDAEAARTGAADNLEQLIASRPTEVADLTRRQERLTAELTDLNVRREELVPGQGAQVIVLYDSLRKTRGGRALAKVEQGMCQGCRLTLSTGELQQTRGNRNVVQCSSCNRILYFA